MEESFKFHNLYPKTNEALNCSGVNNSEFQNQTC